MSEVIRQYVDGLRLCLITFTCRSGSILLHNLLDGSEDVISVPPSAFHSWDINILLDLYNERRFSATEILDTFPRLALNTDEIGNTTGVDPGLFEIYYESIIRSYETLSVAIIFRALHVAYDFALRGPSTERSIICFQLHTPVDNNLAEYLSSNFSKCYHLITVRNPIVAIDSYLATLITKDDPDHFTWASQATCEYFVESLGAFRSRKEPGELGIRTLDNTVCVRFEDMHRSTINTMKKVAKFLEISYSPIMDKTTVDGNLYWFDSHGQRVTGTSPSVRGKPKLRVLTRKDIALLSILLSDIFEELGYHTGFDFTYTNNEPKFNMIYRHSIITQFYIELALDPCIPTVL